MANVAKKRSTAADGVVLINRDDNRKHVPYGSAPGAHGRLGVAGAAGGVSKLHTIHPGINPPIERELFETLSESPAFAAVLKSRVVYELETPIKQMLDEACGPMLKRSSSLDGLKWWLANETRKEWKKQLRETIMEMESIQRRTGELRDDEGDE